MRSTSNHSRISKTGAGAMAHLEALEHISPDSGFPITLHPHFNPKIRDHVPPEPIREPFTPGKDRALFADPEKKALQSTATQVDLTESIGTVLEDVQLSKLTPQQLDELALLVAERGVVFFRNQDLTTEGQEQLFGHFGELARHPAQKGAARHVVIRGSRDDRGARRGGAPGPAGGGRAGAAGGGGPPGGGRRRM